MGVFVDGGVHPSPPIRTPSVLKPVRYPFTLSVAASRVILGLHYPSDVAAGALIGGLMGYVAMSWLPSDFVTTFAGPV